MQFQTVCVRKVVVLQETSCNFGDGSSEILSVSEMDTQCVRGQKGKNFMFLTAPSACFCQHFYHTTDLYDHHLYYFDSKRQ